MVLERLLWRMTCPKQSLHEPCEFPCLDSCQKRFLWANKEVDLVPHPSCAPSRRCREVFSGIWSRSLDLFLRVTQAWFRSHSHRAEWKMDTGICKVINLVNWTSSTPAFPSHAQIASPVLRMKSTQSFSELLLPIPTAYPAVLLPLATSDVWVSSATTLEDALWC